MNTDLDFGIIQQEQFILSDVVVDDNFFGLVGTNEITSISNISNTPNTPNLIEDGMIVNPFYVGTNNNILVNMTDRELFSKYKRCVAMCKKNECCESQFTLNRIYQKYIKQTDFEELSNYFVLIPVSIKLVKNKLHRQVSLVLDRPVISFVNALNIVLENTEIVIPLFDLNVDNVKTYSMMYEPINDFNTMITANVLYNYYEADSYKGVVLERMSIILNDLKESNYWTNPYYCNMNITDAFQNRTFKLKENIDTNLKASITGKNMGVQDEAVQNVFSKATKRAKNSYDLQNIYRKDTFTDVSYAVKNNGKYILYKVDNIPLSITKEQVNEMFRSVTDNKLMFNMFNSFLLSKTHCHLVLNNQFVLTRMQKLFSSKFVVIYNYIFAYAWLCMYLEECIVKTRTVNTNRYVFDINTANKLPFFPYCHENIHMNPYCTLTVNEKVINSSQNCHGLPMIADYKDYGIDTLDGFRIKFNLFTTGKVDKNIFDGVEKVGNSDIWKHFAISGSIIPACTHKRNPLIDQVTDKNMPETDKIIRYFNEYYNESDIDLMCNSKSVFDYMDNISKLLTVVKKNLNDLQGKDVSNSIEVEPIKTLCVIVNSKYIEEHMKELGDFNYIINNINTPAIKERFYEEYFSVKRDKNKQNRQTKKGNTLYEHFYKIVSIDDMNVMVSSYEITKEKQYETDSDTYIYLNDLLTDDKKVPENQNLLVLKISENIKFKIKSQYMDHSIEAFRTRYDDYFSCVSKFHLPCVRGYYNGNNVYLLPSCITALMTFTNIDYKYFAGIRDPIDIINKYRMRGFGTIINELEKPFITEYNSTVNKWKGMFNVDPKNRQSVKEQFGPKKLNDNIYKPGKFTRGFTDDAYMKVNARYVLTSEDYYNYYKQKYAYTPRLIDFLKIRTLREDGSVEPLKKWILDAAYDELH